MTCYHPLSAWQGESGKVFIGAPSPYSSIAVKRFDLPCGKCIGCYAERARVWSVRCVHEASLWPQNCFITLTYDDQHLPAGGTLVKKHFQDFMKRLRKSTDRFVRYFMCGEYGSKHHRPHYHALLFNFDFDDKVLYRPGSDDLFTSRCLSDLWPFGFSSLGTVTPKSAAYVARYNLKLLDGFKSPAGCVDQYVAMSRRPGIGAGWFEKFGQSDVYAYDSLVVDGHETRPPRYYDELYRRVAGDEALASIKAERLLTASESVDDNSSCRLRVRERCAKARLERLKRSLDYDS